MDSLHFRETQYRKIRNVRLIFLKAFLKLSRVFILHLMSLVYAICDFTQMYNFVFIFCIIKHIIFIMFHICVNATVFVIFCMVFVKFRHANILNNIFVSIRPFSWHFYLSYKCSIFLAIFRNGDTPCNYFLISCKTIREV